MKSVGPLLLRICLVAAVLAGCGGENTFYDAVSTDPMANPTLSFAEPTSQNSVEGDTGPIVLGSGKATVHTTRFDEISVDDFERAADELLAQADAAGYQMELQTSPEGLPRGSYAGTNAIGIHLTIRFSYDAIQVELR